MKTATAAGPAPLVGGVLLCLAIAGAAAALAAQAGVPAVLLALLLGLAARQLPLRHVDSQGVDFCARTLLQIAIALIGLRLPLGELTRLGGPAILLGLGAVLATLAVGTALGLALGLPRSRAVLSAAAVAICGSSAALAVAAVLPRGPDRDRHTIFTIACVTVLSTAAMMLYPLIARLAGLSDAGTGMFLGATIHNLAQVIAAGAIVSPAATDAATVTKLVRVACLAPAVLAASFAFRGAAPGAERPPLLPWFIVAFAIAVAVANSGLLPAALLGRAASLSELCLVTATAALGLKTSPTGLLADGWRPLAVLLALSVLLTAGALFAVMVLAP